MSNAIRPPHSHIGRMLRKIPFIKPMVPTLAKTPPAGEDWIHEVKFDGWRMQAHVEGDEVALFSKNGTDYTRRFRALKPALVNICAKNAIIDCELVACDDSGMPNFRTLMEMGNKAPALCLWCFDLLVLEGVRLMPMPLVQRKAMLAELMCATHDEHLQFSGDLGDPIKLLKVCVKMGLEGIVSKRRESAYRPGPTRDWLKIKTASWRAANRDRWELFDNRN
jgi:bifunctional non-homologous end joining protein LigD